MSRSHARHRRSRGAEIELNRDLPRAIAAFKDVGARGSAACQSLASLLQSFAQRAEEGRRYATAVRTGRYIAVAAAARRAAAAWAAGASGSAGPSGI